MNGQLGWGGGGGTATLNTDTSASSNPGFIRFAGNGGVIAVNWQQTADFQQMFNGTSQARFGSLSFISRGQSQFSSAVATGSVVGHAVGGGGFSFANVGENKQNALSIGTGR